jgi:hypothetical protein
MAGGEPGEGEEAELKKEGDPEDFIEDHSEAVQP